MKTEIKKLINDQAKELHGSFAAYARLFDANDSNLSKQIVRLILNALKFLNPLGLTVAKKELIFTHVYLNDEWMINSIDPKLISNVIATTKKGIFTGEIDTNGTGLMFLKFKGYYQLTEI